MPAKYKLSKSKRFRPAIACGDISGGGLRLLLTEAVKARDRIRVLLFPKDIENPISAHCRVVWCNRCKDGNYNTGLKFLEIKEKDYFIEFLCEKIIDFSFKKR